MARCSSAQHQMRRSIYCSTRAHSNSRNQSVKVTVFLHTSYYAASGDSDVGFPQRVQLAARSYWALARQFITVTALARLPLCSRFPLLPFQQSLLTNVLASWHLAVVLELPAVNLATNSTTGGLRPLSSHEELAAPQRQVASCGMLLVQHSNCSPHA